MYTLNWITYALFTWSMENIDVHVGLFKWDIAFWARLYTLLATSEEYFVIWT